jgi:hypothetical protein
MPKPDMPNFPMPLRIIVGALALVMVVIVLRTWLGIAIF